MDALKQKKKYVLKLNNKQNVLIPKNKRQMLLVIFQNERPASLMLLLFHYFTNVQPHSLSGYK